MLMPSGDISRNLSRTPQQSSQLAANEDLGCGRLADNAREAMGYVLQLGTVHAITVGTTTHDQLIENHELFESLLPLHPLQTRD